ncbi:GNAT family N-acetyltransferase [Nocardioides guangzhouensis]|uniref:GNAT family N-acetyltransferase n=1 Tax=Nocardioides guangzhouensis TaxID=2497878 RepID=A0A4V1XZ67_9ACTN|nr:GNAT family N-acetyltransferase [Nocardioides guangzhouensis]RYP85689.1 GNAT family N-acetyltransferase [Nocardioides guangzhouensis]
MTAFRAASPADAVALRDLERDAGLAALGHIFPPDRYPYPETAVLARWALVLDDPDVRVEVVEGEAGLDCVVAWDVGSVRHLAVRPDAWGSGLARQAMNRALAGIAAGGLGRAVLWCLADNGRARGFYEHLGWRTTGREQEAGWPPYPTEVEYAAPTGAAV